MHAKNEIRPSTDELFPQLSNGKSWPVSQNAFLPSSPTKCIIVTSSNMYQLVVSTQLKNISQNGNLSQNRDENKKCWKPPPTQCRKIPFSEKIQIYVPCLALPFRVKQHPKPPTVSTTFPALTIHLVAPSGRTSGSRMCRKEILLFQELSNSVPGSTKN